ncbi:thiolase family protein [Amycolatopsis rhizosphaerae]|uniref:Thiolase family protein n=1 Tax=Amycolatopsis rhizosphaerae TaxID=2053003 RepID=A0A558DCX7_9PSEU|nr:thiolase family protein [Amycolatopsis rhizosphaerae]TVT58884.1 thiolase family protein [Amycolatopsis rhizosphaerae]
MRTVEVAGVGMTAFGRFPDRTLEDLGGEAVEAALADAGLDRTRLDAAYVGNVLGGGQVGPRVLERVGITGLPIVNVEAACASGSVAFRQAVRAVASGLEDLALVVGVEQVSGHGVLSPLEADRESVLGLTFPAVYAMVARRELEQNGTTLTELAEVAVRNRAAGTGNPRATLAKATSAEEVLASPMVAEPLTRLQCGAHADGAAAIVVAAPGLLSRDRPTVTVRAAAMVSGTSLRRQVDITEGDPTRRAAALAYAEAGLGPADIDVAEVYDPFTIGEIVSVRALGLDRGRTAINPGGGLLGRGHAVGATGVAQLAELTWQLRGEAGARQAGAPTTGLAQTVGGGPRGLDAIAAVVHVLSVKEDQ